MCKIKQFCECINNYVYNIMKLVITVTFTNSLISLLDSVFILNIKMLEIPKKVKNIYSTVKYSHENTVQFFSVLGILRALC